MATIKNTRTLLLQATATRVLIVPTNNPVPVSITVKNNTNGTRDITLTWTYTQGIIKADALGLLWVQSIAFMPGVAPSVAANNGYLILPADATSYTFQGVSPDIYYRVGIVAGKRIDNEWATGSVISPTSSPDWRVNASTPNITANINGVTVATITNAIANFNTQNDNDSTAITIAPTGVTLTQEPSSLGGVDLTVTWAWAGANGDLDGFGVLAHTDTTNAAYTLGQPSDTVFQVSADKRSYTAFNVDPTKYYTVGIIPYRAVNKAVNSTGLIVGPLVQASPYRPNATPNITANVGGTPAATVASYAAGAYTGTVLYRSAGAPTNNPSPVSATVTANTVGGRDIRLDWSGYTQGAKQADGLLLFYKTGSGAPAVTDAAIQFNVTAGASYHIFQNAAVDVAYSAGIAAFRRTENGVEIGTIVTTASWTVAAGTPNITSNIGGTPANTLALNAQQSVDYILSASDDGVWSKGMEKQFLRQQWDFILAEYPQLITQANALGVSSAAFTSASQNLANFANNGVTYPGTGTPTLLQNLTVDSSVAALGGGSTWRSRLAAYAGAKSDLFNAMAAKAATTASWSGLTAIPGTVYNTNDASAMGGNPTFSAWSGTVPDGWAADQITGLSKETTITRIGGNAVKFTTTAGSLNWISRVFSFAQVSKDTIIQGSIDMYLQSVTSGLPAIYIQVGANGGMYSVINAITVTPDSANVGVWHRVPFTIRGDGTNLITGIKLHLMANFAAIGVNFVGTVIYDNFQFTVMRGTDFDNSKQQASQIQGQITGAQVLNGAITQTKTNIAAINPSSGNIQATQASVIAGFFGTLSAINANLGTVNAGNIFGTANINISGTAIFTGYTFDSSRTVTVLANNPANDVGVLGAGFFRGLYGYTPSTTGVGVEGRATASGTSGFAYGVYGRALFDGVGVYAESATGNALQTSGKVRFNSEDFLVNNKKIPRSDNYDIELKEITPGAASGTKNKVKVLFNGVPHWIDVTVA